MLGTWKTKSKFSQLSIVIPSAIIDKRNGFEDLSVIYKIFYAHIHSF